MRTSSGENVDESAVDPVSVVQIFSVATGDVATSTGNVIIACNPSDTASVTLANLRVYRSRTVRVQDGRRSNRSFYVRIHRIGLDSTWQQQRSFPAFKPLAKFPNIDDEE